MIKDKLNKHLQPFDKTPSRGFQFREHSKLRPIIDQCDMANHFCEHCKNSNQKKIT